MCSMSKKEKVEDKKIIDIIIPAYNAHATIKRTLFSIICQTISNQLNIYIVNDASTYDYSEIISFFKKYINISEITLTKNGGPGIAREEGIKNSNAKYIMFIDADDVLANPKAIEFLYNKMEKEKLDFVNSRFIEFTRKSFIEHKRDEIWLHGKMYRRYFLKKNHIHFNDTRANEDNYFNQCVVLSNPKRDYLDETTYFWMYNEKSITRIDDYSFEYNGIFGYIHNMKEALNFAVDNKKDKTLIANKVVSIMYSIYYYYIEYADKNFLDLSKDIKTIFLNYEKYSNDLENIKKNQYEFAINNLTERKIVNSSLTFSEFLEMIGDNND